MKKLLLLLLCLPMIGLKASESLEMKESWIVDSFMVKHYSLFVQHINLDQKQIISSLKEEDGKYVISFLNFDDNDSLIFVTHVLLMNNKNNLRVFDFNLLDKKYTYHHYINTPSNDYYEHISYEHPDTIASNSSKLDTNISYRHLMIMASSSLLRDENRKCWDNNGNIIKCKEKEEVGMSHAQRKALIVFCTLVIVGLIRAFRKKENSN